MTGAECLNVSDLEFMDIDIDTAVSFSFCITLKESIEDTIRNTSLMVESSEDIFRTST